MPGTRYCMIHIRREEWLEETPAASVLLTWQVKLGRAYSCNRLRAWGLEWQVAFSIPRRTLVVCGSWKLPMLDLAGAYRFASRWFPRDPLTCRTVLFTLLICSSSYLCFVLFCACKWQLKSWSESMKVKKRRKWNVDSRVEILTNLPCGWNTDILKNWKTEELLKLFKYSATVLLVD